MPLRQRAALIIYEHTEDREQVWIKWPDSHGWPPVTNPYEYRKRCWRDWPGEVDSG